MSGLAHHAARHCVVAWLLVGLFPSAKPTLAQQPVWRPDERFVYRNVGRRDFGIGGASYVHQLDGFGGQPLELPSVEPSSRHGTGEIVEADSLGVEPEDSGLQFLRRQTPLLKPGNWQFDIGVTYTIAETDLPVGLVGPGGFLTGVTPGRIKQRLMLFPLELRYGWSERTQLFLNVPFGWSNSELTVSGLDSFSNTVGLGDIRGGTTMLLWEASPHQPSDVIGTIGFTAPTGDASIVGTGLTPDARLGEGHWAVSVSFLFVRTYDPLIVFYGLGARHLFDATIDGVDVNPGEQFFYQFGMGFAVNQSVTLSARFSGAYITDDLIEGQRLAGSSLEPMQMRFSVTLSEKTVITEPFAEIGATDDAASVRLGVIWTY